MKTLSVPLKMSIAFFISLGIWLVCFLAARHTDWTVIQWCHDMTLIVVYHFVVMFIAAPIVRLTCRMRFDYQNVWFREKAFEKSLYRFLRVKRWKTHVTVYDQAQLSSKTNTLDGMIMYMCHAEVIHELIALFSFSSFALAWMGVNVIVLLTTSILFAIIHLCFAAIQRYNRPRVVKLKRRYNDHEA